jgi:hypothetical protein
MATITVACQDIIVLADRLEARGTSRLSADQPHLQADLRLAAQLLRVLAAGFKTGLFPSATIEIEE